MWLLFQGLVIFAVIASNFYWHWTPNKYLASIIGVGLAWSLTVLIVKLRRSRAERL
jgi:hypothetical protein